MAGDGGRVERSGAVVDTHGPSERSVAQASDPASKVSFARFIFAEAVLLGCFADVALRTSSLGAGFTLWIAALVATLLMLARRGQAKPAREHYAWLLAALLCSWMFAWRDAELLQFTNLMATLVALMLYAMCTAGAPRGSILDARLRDLLDAWFRSAKHALIGLPSLWRDASMGTAVHATVARRTPFVRALVITIPVLLIFGNLLGSADPVFASLFSLPGVRIDEAISHTVTIAVFTWLCAGSFRGAFVARGGRTLPAIALPRLGTIEITSVLGGLNLLFALFVGLQLRWLFGGAAVVKATTGLTVAEYARRGFFELVWVALLAVPVILGTRALIDGDQRAIQRHRRLAFPLLGFLGAIMLSAVLRMRLYVGYYGLTTDRLYALVFMGWLALVFFFMGATVLRGWSRPFAAMAVISGYAMLGLLNAANPEAIVARAEVNRSGRVRPIDYAYLATLRGDALPIVARALSSAPATEESCKAARQLAERWQVRSDRNIAEWNLGEARGRKVVAEWLTPHSLRRLCASSGTSPSASS
ncbi:MAG TPA: DUF4173 domain-containing protein [Gemmatimonadaceae bacterium]|nr:DUF4173 domain-containing protein [Gemmatimonadaceae bacterium]